MDGGKEYQPGRGSMLVHLRDPAERTVAATSLSLGRDLESPGLGWPGRGVLVWDGWRR